MTDYMAFSCHKIDIIHLAVEGCNDMEFNISDDT